MRGPWLWVVVIVAGVVAVLGVTAIVGRDDNKNQTVSAGEWADSVCGSVAAWRGEIESIVDEIRQPSATGSTGTTEPQSETPQSRTGFVRTGLERTVRATHTMITGVENAGARAPALVPEPDFADVFRDVFLGFLGLAMGLSSVVGSRGCS